jgi:hypothetical protein
MEVERSYGKNGREITEICKIEIAHYITQLLLLHFCSETKRNRYWRVYNRPPLSRNLEAISRLKALSKQAATAPLRGRTSFIIGIGEVP